MYLPEGGVPAGGYLPEVGGMSAGGYLPGGGGTCPGTPLLWTEFLTHAYENITLPQTSFAGGKNISLV